MRHTSAGKIFLAALGSAMVLVAVAFFGLALFTLLQSALPVASAAALTGIALAVIPVGWAIWSVSRPPPPLPRPASPQAAALSALAGIAATRPLLALLGAGLLGAGDYLLRRR